MTEGGWSGYEAFMLDCKVMIKGAGEMASATAHRLFRSGFPLVMTELERPLAVRRAVSFCTAVLEGEVVVEGVPARRWSVADLPRLASFDWSHIPVVVGGDQALLERWRPRVVVDARMLKYNEGNHLGLAPLVVGLGPGLVAGSHVHRVIETNRGHDLGRIIHEGPASADTGVPGTIAGFTGQRVLRAPALGLLQPLKVIGDAVVAGEVLAMVGDEPVMSTLSGVLRGLVAAGTPVSAGLKIGDVDPRGTRQNCFTLSDKARTVSGGVLEAILNHLHPRSA